MRRILTILSIIIFFYSSAFSQIPTPNELEKVCEPYNEPLDTLNQWLIKSPAPFDYQNEERRKMLLAVDEAFLNPLALKLPCVGKYFHSRIDAFMDDYMNYQVTEGVAIWKLYNEGIVIKTASVTFAFDIHSGWDAISWSDEQLYKFLDSLDVVFLSHNHGDHLDLKVIQYLAQKGKTIITMPDILLEKTFQKEMTVVRNKMFDIKGLSIIAYPAYQKETINNVYHVTTPDGISIMHLGDENEIYNFSNEWYRHINEYPRVDVLLPNIWSPDLKNIYDYFNPQLIVIMHEHELQHRVDGRRPYSFVYNVLEGLKVSKAYVLAWGEKVVISKSSTSSDNK